MAAPDIGLYIRTFDGFAGQPPPSWEENHRDIMRAEELGFSSVSFADHQLWRLDEATIGFRDAYTMVAAAAAVTSRIEVGVSVTNTPFRNPAFLAKMVDTLDEVAGGRFVLGIGAGGGYPSDYETLGIPTDFRFSRFAEAIAIVHGLLRDGSIDFTGDYYAAPAAELRPRGPTARGPRIVMAGKGPKMLNLTARYGDEWNWYHYSGPPTPDTFAPLVELLHTACEANDRDPGSMRRSVDIAAAVGGTQETVAANGFGGALMGSVDSVVDALGRFGDAGFNEVRLAPVPDDAGQVELLGEVVAQLHG